MATPTWHGSTDYPPLPPLTIIGWGRALLRGFSIFCLITLCLFVLLMLRLIERPIFGQGRPWTPYITRFVCRTALRILGIGFSVSGSPMQHPGAVVANHASWLDIFTLNATQRIYFVSKAEVAKWPGIGFMARCVGTVFITRDRKDAQAQKRLFEKRLKAGHKLLFFPEGTSTDSLRVLDFKPTLFEAFFADGLREISYVQPVTVNYFAPAGQDRRFYGWWGDMSFGQHLLQVLSAAEQGRAELIFHAPIAVSASLGRKDLARACANCIRTAHLSSGTVDN